MISGSKLKETLYNKKILFIGVKFYHYHLEIQRKLNDYGANVVFFSERDTTIRYGFVNRLFPKWLPKLQHIYFTSLLKNIEHQKFDYLFVIRGNMMPLWFVKILKERNPGIICLMYQWDANTHTQYINLPQDFNIIPEFDKVFSFDFKDVEYHSFIKYLPTFYTDEIKDFYKNYDFNDEKFDFFYFGSYLPERYEGLLKFKKFTEENGYKLVVHFFISYRHYLIEKWLVGAKINRKVFTHNKMKKEEYLNLLKQSKVVVDVSNIYQTGLAMRVIDALGAGKKVLTTNVWVKKEVSYNQNQITLLDLDNIQIAPSFLNTKLEPTKSDYSIDKWLETIFLY